MTQQPEWELVANLGDVSFADYGGMLVYRDKTGVYQPEAEVYEPGEETPDGEPNGGMVYRFVLEPPRFRTNGRRNADGTYKRIWHNEWWVKDLPSIARSYAQDSHRYLLKDLLSKYPVRLGMAYMDLIGYHGCFAYDQYPIELTEEEAQKRYADIGRESKVSR